MKMLIDMMEIPHPVKHDSKMNTADMEILDWAYKIREELDEALAAKNEGELAAEIADIATVCISWLEALNYDENKRRKLFYKTNIKNMVRGYFEEQK